ncbi:MAG: hypothetical protein DRP57_08875 [Spirochaetes bacterium]|nr:MAG: hypothetical protein DRP57_08875 [Spirochaetota bacterium]
MRKALILKEAVLLILVSAISACTSFGLQAKRVEVSPFGDVKPPYIFLVKSVSIINRDGFPTGESFIDDFLVSTGYKYRFRFLFPEKAGEKSTAEDSESKSTGEGSAETGGESVVAGRVNATTEAAGANAAPYIMDLFVKEKGFSNDLKELTAISGTLHIYSSGSNDTDKKPGQGTGSLLCQIVLTEESTVSINSYYKLYSVIDEIFNKLHSDLRDKQKERERDRKKAVK